MRSAARRLKSSPLPQRGFKQARAASEAIHTVQNSGAKRIAFARSRCYAEALSEARSAGLRAFPGDPCRSASSTNWGVQGRGLLLPQNVNSRRRRMSQMRKERPFVRALRTGQIDPKRKIQPICQLGDVNASSGPSSLVRGAHPSGTPAIRIPSMTRSRHAR